MWIEISALIISYFGVFTGAALGKIAKQEVIHGKKYLSILQHFLIFAVFFWFFTSHTTSELSTKILIAFALVAVYLITKNNYLVLGIVFGIKPDFVMGSLIFLYGFPAGSLMCGESFPDMIKKTVAYLAAGFITLIIV